jgi:hypothetical protein
MNYATWKLNFTDSKYGTGPEDKIAELGFGAEGAWVAGQIEKGGIILGYVTGTPVESALTAWEYTPITQEAALEFALAINPEAYLLEDGRIGAPVEEPWSQSE